MSNSYSAGLKVTLLSSLIIGLVLFFGAFAFTTNAEEATTPVEETSVVVESETPAVVEEAPAPAVTEEAIIEAPAAVVLVPELSTDKDDYHPTQTATIFGKFFGVLQNYVVKIFGSDDNDQNYTESTSNVATDESGAFSLSYLLDSLYRPFYRVAVSTPEGNVVAESYFRDAAIDVYDQCSNDDGDGYATGNTGCRWINGNLQSNNSTYFEGDSTVQRLSIKGLTPGTTHTVTLKYGTTKAGKHAYDFLTTWDASENWISVADRCDGITTGCDTAAETTFPIPHDPNGSGQFESDFATRNFVMRGGTITGATAPAIVSGSYAGDSETIVTITYTVGASNGSMCSTKSGITSCAIALWVGAHISEGNKWFAFNGSTGAGSISGSPYHVALADFDGDTTSAPTGGGRDNQMQAGAIIVAPTIVINKICAGGTGGSFGFSISGATASTPNLGCGQSTGSTTVAVGTYSVAENTPPSGWALTGTACQKNGSNSSNSNVALASGDVLVCNFTNTLQTGHLIVQKTTLPSGDTTSFSINATGSGTITGGGAGSITDALDKDYTVTTGTYSVAETVPAGWDKTGDTCQNVIVAAGQTATCTITNTKKGHLIVEKTTVPAADPTSFSISASGSGSISGSASGSITDANDKDYEVTPGTYSVTETVPSGWNKTGDTCQSVVVAAGQTVHCTITNTKQSHLIVDKVTVPSGDSQSFNFTTNAGSNFSLTDAGAAHDSGAVAPGTYSVSETVPSGWDQSSAICSDGSPASAVVLSAGETVTCTFTNTKRGSLTIVKNTVGGNGTFNFTMGGGLAPNPSITTVSNTGSATFNNVTPGTYSAAETVPGGWDLTSATCSDGSLVSSIQISAGENVTCTFTNTKKATLKIQKTVVNDNGGTATSANFQGKIDGTDVAWDSAVEVTVGAHSASEATLPTYTASSWGGDCAVDGSVTLAAGDAKVCTITNDDNAPALHLRKVVTNNNGGTATVADFTLTANGTGSNDLSGTSPVDSGAGLKADTFALSETGIAGYAASSWTCVGGTQNGASITLGLGESATCTITNDDIAPQLTVIKHVINDNGGTAVAGSFTMNVTATNPSQASFAGAENPGTTITLNAGAYSVDESAFAGYTKTLGANCSGTIAVGESKTCTITNNDQQAYIVVDKTVVNDNGGTAAPNDFLLTVDGNAVSDEVAYPVNPGVHTAGETLLSGYSAGAWGGDCDVNASVTVALGETKTCTITNNDISPKLIVIKHVVNDNGGTAVAANFTLDAGGTNDTPDNFAGAEAPGTEVTLNVGSYNVSESGPAGYAASYSADCSGTIALGETKTCTVTNDDIQPKLTLIKHVTNDNGGNAVVADFPLFVGTTGVTSGVQSGFNAGSYTASETNLTGYTASSWTGDCAADGSITLAVGDVKTCHITNDDQPAHVILNKVVTNNNGGQAGINDFGLTVGGGAVTSGQNKEVNANTAITLNEVGLTGYSFVSITGDAKCPAVLGGTVTLDEGETVTCTITNDDIAPKLHLRKVVTNNNGGTKTVADFTLTADGTGANDLSGTSPVDSAATLQADTFALSETNVAGYTASSWTCVGGTQNGSNITVGIGGEATCTITNDDQPAKLTIVKDAQPNDLIDFAFNGTNGLGNFLLDDDSGVADIGQNDDVDQSNTKVFTNVNAGNYTVTETQPNQYWLSKGISCVNNTTQTAFPGVVNGNAVTVTLPLGADVTCTFVNEKKSPTRTLGFWQTHTAYTSTVFGTKGPFWIGLNVPVASGTHKGQLTAAGQVFGAFFSNIAKTSTGGKRAQIDQTRMQLLQQLMAAKLNCAAFGCAASVQTMISGADAAYAGNNQGSIQSYVSQLDAYNNSGDTITIGSAGSATPNTSKSQADYTFWDLP